MQPVPLRGKHLLEAAIGQRLLSVRRWILDFGRANGAFGHGHTELRFTRGVVTVSPGPNEDHARVNSGPMNTDNLDPRFWSALDLDVAYDWCPPEGVLERVDLLTDGVDDIGVRLRFDGGGQLMLGLVDTDLVLGHDLELFERDPSLQPVLRETLVGRDSE